MARIRLDSRWQLRVPAEALRGMERRLVLRVMVGWLAFAGLAALY